MRRSAGNSGLVTVLAATAALLAATVILMLLLTAAGSSGTSMQANTANMAILDKYDMFMTNQISEALDGFISVEKVYWLSDEDLVAPEPDPQGFGRTEDPASLAWLLEDAQKLLQGQRTLFTTETPIREGSEIHYYLDETILAITWKQVIDRSVYTISEVKIAHPSQFRRFMAGGEYGTEVLYTTTEMAASVNAVVASSGDYYSYRSHGVVVNNAQVYRAKGIFLDTCYIDENGDLLFTYAREIMDEAAAQKVVEDNNVRFSLSFGPVMVKDGEVCVPGSYNSGEINDPYPRAALGQMDQLHYVLVTVNTEEPYSGLQTVGAVAQRLCEMGIPTVYALDGGQTAAIAMNDELINSVNYGHQREISDIIYFATAVPDGK